MALIPRLTASVQWRELLRLHLVADAQFDRPRIHLNLPQLRAILPGFDREFEKAREED